MAQWIVSRTTIPAGKDSEADWEEISAHAKHGDALKVARKLRKSSPPKVRIRASIDHARGGMTG
jgi:hypothetical protein